MGEYANGRAGRFKTVCYNFGVYKDPDKQKAYARKHYLDNKELYKSRAALSNKRIKADNKENLLLYLLLHPCTDCDETDPVVLQFDHVGPDKTANVGKLVNGTNSWNRIMREIEKCEVVCANCHFRRTAKRDGRWHKSILGD